MTVMMFLSLFAYMNDIWFVFFKCLEVFSCRWINYHNKLLTSKCNWPLPTPIQSIMADKHKRERMKEWQLTNRMHSYSPNAMAHIWSVDQLMEYLDWQPLIYRYKWISNALSLLYSRPYSLYLYLCSCLWNSKTVEQTTVTNGLLKHMDQYFNPFIPRSIF